MTDNQLLNEFISFAKDEYNITIKPIESNVSDSFEKIFGIHISEKWDVGVNTHHLRKPLDKVTT